MRCFSPNIAARPGRAIPGSARTGSRSWRASIGDITAGAGGRGRGIADANRRRSSAGPMAGMRRCSPPVIKPALYKAVVAIAPVTDLGRCKTDDVGISCTPSLMEQDIVARAAFRRRLAAAPCPKIRAPVLLFHGDQRPQRRSRAVASRWLRRCERRQARRADRFPGARARTRRFRRRGCRCWAGSGSSSPQTIGH